MMSFPIDLDEKILIFHSSNQSINMKWENIKAYSIPMSGVTLRQVIGARE